ncbi:MAG: glycosyltransferase, partial [Actinomycetota bacterium]
MTIASERTTLSNEGSTAPADVAVAIVNYNAGDYLLACIESLLANAGGARLDVLVIDNASQDGSARRAADAFPQ